MEILSIDIETFSSNDLIKGGVYSYASALDFTILLFGYHWKGKTEVVDLAQGEKIPQEILKALTDPNVKKTAFNAQFERVCLNTYLKTQLPINQWQCTSVKSSMTGLPHDLNRVGAILKLKAQKDASGKTLIKYFSLPCKPTIKNGGRTRNLPEHDPEAWQEFKDYCKQDVEVEIGILEALKWFKVPKQEILAFHKDQQINDKGIMVDLDFAQACVDIDEVVKAEHVEEMKRLSGIENPNSVAQIKAWLKAETGVTATSLTKDTVKKLIDMGVSDKVRRVLELRQLLGKTSTKKYEAMLNSACPDERVRGLVHFYGANRTGRWAGRIVQLQNLPQNHIPDLDMARQLVRNRDIDTLRMMYGSVPNILSQLIRTALIAKEGHTFVVADFSAIEARVIAWLAQEKWRLDVFNGHGKIYEASASAAFGIPIEQITKGSDLRQKGKVMELACGFQGGVGAIKQMGGEDMGLSENDMKELVDRWRAASKNIVRFWYDVERCVMKAIGGEPQTLRNLKFYVEKGCLMIQLPSGRCLVYRSPALEDHPKFDGKQAITFFGLNQTTKNYEKQYTYGGKLVENIVQGAARDCLVEIMLKIKNMTVGHVHDEVILEVPEERAEEILKKVIDLMGKEIPWAKGLPLAGDGYITKYYKKD